LAFHKIKEIEKWLENLLAAPVPTPGKSLDENKLSFDLKKL